jgi:RNA polymerase sigma-70 factor, ECF subfamily
MVKNRVTPTEPAFRILSTDMVNGASDNSNMRQHEASASPRDLKSILESAAGGREHAARDLLPLVYRSLRDLAERHMRNERRDHTLQATALVHEAYARLVGEHDMGWDSRAHFYGAAAEAMRRILIEHARRIGAKKRGGDRVCEIASVADLSTEESIADALDIDDAIEALRAEDPRAASVAQLRFYTGLSIEETAATLNVSQSTVDREWCYARAWLLRHLRHHGETETPK